MGRERFPLSGPRTVLKGGVTAMQISAWKLICLGWNNQISLELRHQWRSWSTKDPYNGAIKDVCAFLYLVSLGVFGLSAGVLIASLTMTRSGTSPWGIAAAGVAIVSLLLPIPFFLLAVPRDSRARSFREALGKFCEWAQVEPKDIAS